MEAPDSPFELFCLKHLQPICDLSWMDEGWSRSRSRVGRKARVCYCKRSKCMKGYCECFAEGRMCSGCGCVECQNTGKDAGKNC